jgi:REP element-mobilizing transposase RayT
MARDPSHHRRSIRLKGYDYTQPGAYFVTIVTQGRRHLFGEVTDGRIVLNDAGQMVTDVWMDLPHHYPGVMLDAFVTMPNHIHGIIVLVGAGPCACPNAGNGATTGGCPYVGLLEMGQPQGVAPTLGLPDVVHRFKTMTTKRYADGVKHLGWQPFPGRLWQRNYYEHVIRTDDALDRIREYIASNPLRWHLDRENPAATGHDDVWESLFRRSLSRQSRAGGRP